MISSKVIIIGAGPAGSACAGQLNRAGIPTLILEKKVFPRPKICAGWVTPGVFRTLGTDPEQYPYPLTRFQKIHFYFWGIRIPAKTRQFAVRRIEFDPWLLKQSGVPVYTHTARHIKRVKDSFIIDDAFECRVLIGAGGTHCPAAKTFFNKKGQPSASQLICAVESEYQISDIRKDCHIWYFNHQLPGYAWYLPKKGGWLNLGIGGKFLRLKQQGKTIMDHWRLFINDLKKKSFIRQNPTSPKGHVYYLHHQKQSQYPENVYIIGDAQGLSTRDMGEGIHAAVKSGIAAADAIIHQKPLNMSRLSRFSLPGILFPNLS